MNITQTPSTDQALEAALILGRYFDNVDLSHSQRDEEAVLTAFATVQDVVDGPANAVAALVYLLEQVNYAIESHVLEARSEHASWTDIGDALGVSKQAAQQKYGQ